MCHYWDEIGRFRAKCLGAAGFPQVVLHELVDVAIENGRDVPFFKVCAVILHHLIRVHYLGTDLTAPRDFALIAVQAGPFDVALGLAQRDQLAL